MSWLGDNLDFEKFNLGKIWDNIKSNPLQAALGAEDPLSAKVWNGVLGTNWQPSVDQMGGPTGATFNAAQRAGINTGPASTMHDIAHAIAGAEAGSYFGGALASSGGGVTSVGDLGDFTPASGGSSSPGLGSFMHGLPSLPGLGGGGANQAQLQQQQAFANMLRQNQYYSLAKQAQGDPGWINSNSSAQTSTPSY